MAKKIKTKEHAQIILSSLLDTLYDSTSAGIDDFWEEQGDKLYKFEMRTRRNIVRDNIVQHLREHLEGNVNVKIIESNNFLGFLCYDEFLIKVKSVDESGIAQVPSTQLSFQFNNNDELQLEIPGVEPPTSCYLAYRDDLIFPGTPDVSLICPNGKNGHHWSLQLNQQTQAQAIDITRPQARKHTNSRVKIKPRKEVAINEE